MTAIADQRNNLLYYFITFFFFFFIFITKETPTYSRYSKKITLHLSSIDKLEITHSLRNINKVTEERSLGEIKFIKVYPQN